MSASRPSLRHDIAFSYPIRLQATMPAPLHNLSLVRSSVRMCIIPAESVNRRIDRLTRTHASFLSSLTDQVRMVEMGPDSSLPGLRCISTVLGDFANAVQRFPDRGLEYADAASIAPLHSASTIGIPSFHLVRANSTCVLLGFCSFSHSHAELPVYSPNILSF